MRLGRLISRNLTWYWRTNLAVAVGVSVATAVLAGALVVGDSVRVSLRNLVLSRLGNTETALQSSRLFRETLAAEFGGQAVPLLALEAIAIHQTSGRRAARVLLYGVDDRFWAFHRLPAPGMSGRELIASEALGRELGASAGDAILLRVEKPSEIPRESLHGRKEEAVTTLRFEWKAVLPSSRLGEFSLAPTQSAVRAVFVPLSRLQKELAQPRKVNVVLLAGITQPESILRRKFALEDVGLRVKPLPRGAMLQVESPAGLLDEATVRAVEAVAGESGAYAAHMLTYLVNSIGTGGRDIPYSLVTAIDLPQFSSGDAIVLNDWAARDLGARLGDKVTLEFYVWLEHGQLDTGAATFRLSAVVPTNGPPGDRDFAPEYPGITDSADLADWDPPFPMDLGRIRKIDEDYWDRFRTTPKAFISLPRGRQLWASRFGSTSSIRVAGAAAPFATALRGRLDPLLAGFTAVPVRQRNLAAAAGATDFGQYFTYFSFFLVVSALLLSALVFRLGIEQRVREIGVLKAMGFSHGDLRKIFLAEGAVLAGAGSLAGALLASLYAGLILHGLRTWWVDAVGTRELELSVTPFALASGAAGGLAAAFVSIVLALRELKLVTPVGLLAGPAFPHPSSFPRMLTIGSTLAAAGFLAGGLTGGLAQGAAFFGTAAMLLAAMLSITMLLLNRPSRSIISGHGKLALVRLGLRSAGSRSGRSVLSIALIAFATFLIVSLDTFRRSPRDVSLDRRSGTGGYRLLAESLSPVYHDLGSPAARSTLGFDNSGWQEVRIVSFRTRPGDDVSCLNLYQPLNPRVLGAPASFLKAGRFTFHSSLAHSHEQRTNPWLLLEAAPPGGAIPAAVDANSMTYILHAKLGDEILAGGARLRLVAALSDSVFQSELIVSEENFRRAFPKQEGYRFFLLEGKTGELQRAAAQLEESLEDSGFDAYPSAERLAQFHRVENTYISTFQSLGGLGLIIGTFGLAVVLLRNVLERRRELALLQAVGYRTSDLRRMVLAENLLFLLAGTCIGVLCALVAVAPALAARGGWLGGARPMLLPLLVVFFGWAASLTATRAALRSPLLESLRTE
jgi:ABC-type antimicrobial peptide transport system permease subunit